MIINDYHYNNFEWIDIENPSRSDLGTIEYPFPIDENLLEDALEPGHLPKIEKTKDYIFIILRAYSASEDEKAIEVGQISNKIAFLIYKHTTRFKRYSY